MVRGTARALLEATGTPYLNSIELSHSWVESVYRHLGFVKRMATTSRPPIPKGLYEECRDQFLRDIERAVKEFTIPPELVLNSDQTPSSFISVGRSTMASCGTKSVTIKDSLTNATLL